MCSGDAFDGTPYTCHCHDPKSQDDWFPRSELEQSFSDLVVKLENKLGLDVRQMFFIVSASGFPVYTFSVPQFVPGSSPFTITIDIEQYARDYSGLVSMVRLFFFAMIWLVTIRILLFAWRTN